MGAQGSALSTLIARTAMTLVAVILVLRHVAPGREWFRYRRDWMRKVLKLGLPSAGQMTLEVGVFATATLLAGSLAADQMAAHQIVLNVASVMFMVPLGLVPRRPSGSARTWVRAVLRPRGTPEISRSGSAWVS